MPTTERVRANNHNANGMHAGHLIEEMRRESESDQNPASEIQKTVEAIHGMVRTAHVETEKQLQMTLGMASKTVLEAQEVDRIHDEAQQLVKLYTENKLTDDQLTHRKIERLKDQLAKIELAAATEINLKTQQAVSHLSQAQNIMLKSAGFAVLGAEIKRLEDLIRQKQMH